MFVIYNQRPANCNRHLSMANSSATARAGARTALALLLAINLFNYIDRYILAAVLPRIRHDFLAGDPHQFQKAGWLFPAFLKRGQRVVGTGGLVYGFALHARVRRNW